MKQKRDGEEKCSRKPLEVSLNRPASGRRTVAAALQQRRGQYQLETENDAVHSPQGKIVELFSVIRENRAEHEERFHLPQQAPALSTISTL